MKPSKKKLYEKQFLNEISTNRDDDIKKAINKVLKVRISYNDKKPHVISKTKGKKERYILPVAYGVMKNGKRAIRAFQTAGSTKRGVPKWQLFLLDNIISWTNGKKSFKQYGDVLKKLGLNTEGDMHMTTLFALTPIGNKDVPVAKDSKPINAEPLTKPEVEPTIKNQSPDIITKDNNFVINTKKQEPSIDNVQNKNYFTNKSQEPKTEPIIKTDVQPQIQNEPQNDINPVQKQDNQQQKITTEPVTKDEINGTEINKDNKLTTSFNDMMNRMDNLNNNEDEEK